MAGTEYIQPILDDPAVTAEDMLDIAHALIVEAERKKTDERKLGKRPTKPYSPFGAGGPKLDL